MHPDGRVFFAPGVWPGERGCFEVTALKGRMGFAKLLELTQASDERVDAPCPHHGVAATACGGCPWQFVRYTAQLAAKQQRVEKALTGLCDSAIVAPILGSKEALGYRNRAQLKSDGKRLGFVAGGSKQIAEIEDCLVLNSHNRQTLRALRAQLPNPDWRPGRGKQWVTLDLDDLIDASEVQLDERRPFRQGNSAQNQHMRAWLAGQLASLKTPSPAIELFAGSGNFTEILASHAGEITAVDSFSPAVDQLAQRGLPGVTSRCHDLSREEAAESLTAQLKRARLLLLDPPRDGLKNLGDYLSRAKALETIIYISCNPATLARDLKTAADSGFKLRQVQALDLFPQTPHVEVLTVALR
jgi:23S rRNA (uracil1939-C5)-methyltransferase